MSEAPRRWRIGIDIGGTFTDIVTAREDGLVTTRKVPSTPDDYSRGIAIALEAWLAETGAAPAAVCGIVHATTVATNAILESEGARTGLVTTAGFRDVLEMRRLRIPVLYDLQYDKPRPLVDRALRLEARERIGADGGVRVPLVEEDVVAAARRLKAEGVEAVAISFLHAYANPAHEIAAERILAAELGPGVYLCRGSEILPEIREYERTSTAVVNAYVGPVVARYASALLARLAELGIACPVEMMHSAGGIMRLTSAVRRAASLVESGPAAGVIACARIAREIGDRAVISFDMGGTTAKAALIEDGEPTLTTDYEVGAGINLSSKLVKGGGYPIRMPFIDVSEIGAGGGSLIALDQRGQIRVGPKSAGSNPGPVCYGFGGTRATLTDALVTLGYVNGEALAGGTLPIDAEAARRALFDQIARPLGLSLERAARGAMTLAVATMTRAVKAVTTYRGRDPRDATLAAFGGNGPVVAADLAAALGITRIAVPPAAGVFSALGLLRSDIEQDFVKPAVIPPGEDGDAGLAAALSALACDARATLRADGYDLRQAAMIFGADLRYAGQAFELTVPVPERPTYAALAEAFHREHERSYGHRAQGAVHVVSLRLKVRLPAAAGNLRPANDAPRRPATDRHVIFDGGAAPAAVIDRRDLDERFRAGPFIVEEDDCTCVVPPDFSARLDPHGSIDIRRKPH